MTFTSAEFDLDALYRALDAHREARGLSWAQLSREIGVATGTLRGLGVRRAAEGDGVLQMLRWLGRSPESFTNGLSFSAEASALPTRVQGVLRFDARRIYAALQARRGEQGMSWHQVAAAVGGGTTAAGLMRLRKGGRVSFPQVMRICGWLGEPAACFVHDAPR
jgi:transcriptional regulator with XRE-family HTH domain